MAGLGFSRLHLLPLSTSSRPTSAVAPSGRYLPCLSPITWDLAVPHHPRLSQLLSKPMLNPQVLAASSPLRALFTPRILPSKAHLALCPLPRSWLPGRGQGESGSPGWG